jgi:hypothetical protein
MSLQDRKQQIFDDKSSEGDHFRRSDDHETHTTALVFLVATVVVVIGVAAFSGGGPDTAVGPTGDDSVATPEADSPDANQDADTGPTPGPSVSVRTPDMQEVDGVTGLPDGFPVGDVESISRNQQSDLGEGKTQRLLSYSSRLNPAEAFAKVFDWQKQKSGWTLQDRSTDDESLAVTTARDNQSLTALVTKTDAGSKVRINYIY